MFAVHFNAAQVRDRLDALVARIGRNHVPQSSDGTSTCVYANVVNGSLTPVCLIGQFVADLGLLGLIVEEAPVYNGEPAQHDACNIGTPIWDSLESGGVTFTEDAKTYMRHAQAAQDNGRSWGNALKYADAKFVEDAENKARETLGMAVPFTSGVSVSDFTETF